MMFYLINLRTMIIVTVVWHQSFPIRILIQLIERLTNLGKVNSWETNNQLRKLINFMIVPYFSKPLVLMKIKRKRISNDNNRSSNLMSIRLIHNKHHWCTWVKGLCLQTFHLLKAFYNRLSLSSSRYNPAKMLVKVLHKMEWVQEKKKKSVMQKSLFKFLKANKVLKRLEFKLSRIKTLNRFQWAKMLSIEVNLNSFKNLLFRATAT